MSYAVKFCTEAHNRSSALEKKVENLELDLSFLRNHANAVTSELEWFEEENFQSELRIEFLENRTGQYYKVLHGDGEELGGPTAEPTVGIQTLVPPIGPL